MGLSRTFCLMLLMANVTLLLLNLLMRYFNEVDLLEPVSHFLETARESLAPENLMVSDMHKAANFFCVPLQEFTPEAGRYDIICVQWCIGHLTDNDFVSFFTRAKVGLKPGDLFVLKENIARTGGFVLDKEDRSITRSDLYYKELFRQCGLHLHRIKGFKLVSWWSHVPWSCDSGKTSKILKMKSVVLENWTCFSNILHLCIREPWSGVEHEDICRFIIFLCCIYLELYMNMYSA